MPSCTMFSSALLPSEWFFVLSRTRTLHFCCDTLFIFILPSNISSHNPTKNFSLLPVLFSLFSHIFPLHYFPPLFASQLPFSFLLFSPCFSYCSLFFPQVPQILLSFIYIIMTYLIIFLLLSQVSMFSKILNILHILSFKYPFCTFFHSSIFSVSF